MIAGLIAQGACIFDASIAGVYLHGLAGDIASEYKTEYGVTAQDVLEHIPEALKKVIVKIEGITKNYLTTFKYK